MKKNKLKETIKKLIDEIEEEELEEMTTTGTTAGSEEYSTPGAFSNNAEDKKKRDKRAAYAAGHWNVVKEENNLAKLKKGDIITFIEPGTTTKTHKAKIIGFNNTRSEDFAIVKVGKEK